VVGSCAARPRFGAGASHGPQLLACLDHRAELMDYVSR
jgi:hypothetical protein